MNSSYEALTSTVTADGHLRLAYTQLALPTPRENQVIVRMEAVPINPSDIGFLLGPGDLDTIELSDKGDGYAVSMALIDAPSHYADRLDRPLQICAEGAGVVVDAGAAAQSLIGKTVAVMAGRMLAEYRCVDASLCLVMPDGVSAIEAAGAIANPLTALGMIEVMRREGHAGLVHTAAASNLGQILIRACLADDIPLVNVVRRPEQAQLLRSIGARHVCDSSAPSFRTDLEAAIAATGATIAFEAIGGGQLAGIILSAMEKAAAGRTANRTPYGTAVHKQIYVYGMLDPSPLILAQDFGMAWSVSGWLMTPEQAGGAERYEDLRQRVAREIKTTFASHYGHELAWDDLLRPSTLKAVAARATGEKHIVLPQRRGPSTSRK